MTNEQRLQKENEALRAEIEALKIHAPYGILSRAGLEYEKRNVVNNAQYAIFGDIDRMHELNKRYGYETVNGMIKEALTLRHDDLLLTGLWFSGDELVFVVKSNAQEFCERIGKSFNKFGMSITLAYAEIEDNNLNSAIDLASKMVQDSKESSAR
jgi:GGDEF domain-containing protein